MVLIPNYFDSVKLNTLIQFNKLLGIYNQLKIFTTQTTIEDITNSRSEF